MSTATSVAANPAATTADVAVAKTALMTAADNLAATEQERSDYYERHLLEGHQRQPDLLAGWGVFKFGDTYYWYGVHYQGAESYRANPTKKYDTQIGFVAIPVYSSKDLVNWKFERNVATAPRPCPAGAGSAAGSAGWVWCTTRTPASTS